MPPLHSALMPDHRSLTERILAEPPSSHRASLGKAVGLGARREFIPVLESVPDIYQR